jgi:L,D-peptidoglycan transpeptidase YkuD (ErfK/YbiS/YcfS/YnhG family)
MKADRWPSIAACALFAMSALARAAGVPTDTQQLIVVVTSGWDANQGVMYTFEREATSWQPRMRDVAVSIGRAGSAWGAGVHEPQQGVQKQEGDGRSPAGMFELGLAFGYAANERAGIPYRGMTAFDYCIDVNGSPDYNRIVDARYVDRATIEKSTEPMRRDIHANGDQRYKLGFEIEHNPANVSGQGSCIFAHLWGTPGQTTAGCTAMSERTMRDLLAWLDVSKEPVFVLLPYAEYRRLQVAWNLPNEVTAPK